MNNNDYNNRGGGGENDGLTQCVAIYDCIGNPKQNKLQFRIYDLVEDVNYGISPQNGYRLGRIRHQQGWFPHWAVQPVTKERPPPPTLACPPPPSSQQERLIHDDEYTKSLINPMMVHKNEKVEIPMHPTMIHQNEKAVSPSKKFNYNNDEEATNILRPRRSHKSLSQGQSILLLKFIVGSSSPETDVGRFKAYCSIHSEQLGEQGSSTRRFIQNN